MRCVLVGLLFLFSHVAIAQNAVELECLNNIQAALEKASFKQVKLQIGSKELILAYENRSYRFAVAALEKVVTETTQCDLKGRNLVLVPQHRGLPIGSIKLSWDDLSIPLDANRSFISEVVFSNRIPDITLSRLAPQFALTWHPQYQVQFGDWDRTTEAQVSLVPELEATFWKGMRLSAQVVVPLHNELSYEGNQVRPGHIVFNQVFRLSSRIWISASTGYFSQNRYGFDVDVRRFGPSRSWSIGVDVGYTGYASFRKGTWYYSDLNDFLLLGVVNYRIAPMDLRVEAAYGQFLYDDIGWRFTATRYWGEVSIGLLALQTETGVNGGFQFSIPLFPRRYPQIGSLALRSAPNIGWSYRYRGFPQGGKQYSTGTDIDEFGHPFSSINIKEELLQ